MNTSNEIINLLKNDEFIRLVFNTENDPESGWNQYLLLHPDTSESANAARAILLNESPGFLMPEFAKSALYKRIRKSLFA